MRWWSAILFFLIASPAAAEWEAALYGGGSFTTKTDAEVSGVNLTLKQVKVDTSGTVGGKVGYWWAPIEDTVSLGIGLDVFYFAPTIPGQTVSGTFGTIPVTASFTAITVTTVGVGLDLLKVRLPLLHDEEFPDGRVFPMVAVGPAVFFSTFESVTPTSSTTTHESSLGVKASAGLEARITPMVGFFGEYRFTQFAAETTRSVIAPGLQNVSATFTSHHLVGGLAIHF